ncbi:MAG: O-antigen ligase family protein [Blastocatellia bacterium]|nr:O-antigen ligase family protein [Blastocatellia bacterium]
MTWANKTAFVLMFGIVAFTTLAYGGVHQPVIVIFYLAVASLMVLWVVDAVKSGVVRISPSVLQLPLFAVAIYSLIQILPFGSIADIAGVNGIPRTISVDPFSTKLTAIQFFALAFFFSASLVLLDSAARIRRAAMLVTVFGFGFAFFAVLQSVLSPDRIYGIYETRFAVPFGSFVNRHNFAAFMEMTLSIPLGLLFAGAVTRDKRLLYVTAIALMGAALLLSGSRGGLVAFISQLILLVILTLGSRTKRNIVLRLGLAIALIAAITGGAFFVGGDTSLTRIAETSASKDLTTDRLHIWGVAIRVIGAHMPFGAGFGAFGVAYTAFDSYSGLERVEQAHNDYLQVVADGGIIGFLIGVGFLWLVIRTGLRSSQIDNTYRRGIAIGAFSGISALLVHSIFDFVLHTTAVALLFLLLMTLLIAAGFSYKDDVEDATDRHRRMRRSPRRSLDDLQKPTIAEFKRVHE